MVKDRKQHTVPRPAKQGVDGVVPEPNKIGAGTPYNLEGRNLTAYGGLLPVATMLEKLGFQELVDGTLTVKRQTKVLTLPQFVLRSDRVRAGRAGRAPLLTADVHKFPCTGDSTRAIGYEQRGNSDRSRASGAPETLNPRIIQVLREPQ